MPPDRRAERAGARVITIVPVSFTGDVRVERALDVERVVADAEQQVDDLDRALGAVRVELAVDELDGAVADAAREDRRLAEGLRVAARVGRAEVEVLRPGRGPDSVVDVIVPGAVLLGLPSLKMLRTSICFDSGGCVPILNSGPSLLARQLERRAAASGRRR